MLDTTVKDGWQIKGGGDIVTDESFENYEFSIDTIKDLDVKFIIAGKSDNAYADKIDENLELNNYKNIIRKKGYIPDKEYLGLFGRVFAPEKAR